jgi:hypothetical protein
LSSYLEGLESLVTPEMIQEAREAARRLPKYLAEIKLDYDRKTVPWKKIAAVLRRAGYRMIVFEWRQTKNGWHVWLTLDPAPRTAMEVIALQAMLGSDPMREACNLRRARKLWRTPAFARSWWNVLYRPRELSRFQISHLRGGK